MNNQEQHKIIKHQKVIVKSVSPKAYLFYSGMIVRDLALGTRFGILKGAWSHFLLTTTLNPISRQVMNDTITKIGNTNKKDQQKIMSRLLGKQL